MHLLPKRHRPPAPAILESRHTPDAPFLSDFLAVRHPTPQSLYNLNMHAHAHAHPAQLVTQNTGHEPTPPELQVCHPFPPRGNNRATQMQLRVTSCNRVQCARCSHRRWPCEYPDAPPTSTCTHGVCRCVYCLHEWIRIAVVRAGKPWKESGVVCPEEGCEEVLGVEDVKRGVLVWRRTTRRRDSQGRREVVNLTWWFEGLDV